MSNKKKILLVDDDLDLLEQNRLLIESKGYEVITANSGKEGFETFKRVKPEDCVVDLILEKKD